MAVSNADKQRRYRAHHKGDHSLCDPDRICNRVTDASRFGRRGSQLWLDLGGERLKGGQRALLEEICRLADRLDRLDDFLRGREDAWMRLRRRTDDPSTVRVIVDQALAEVRQQQLVFRQLLADLKADSSVKPEASLADELAAVRRRRAAGS